MSTSPCASGGHRLQRAAARAASTGRAFLRQDGGQDVIEYGLLSAFFGIVCIAVWLSIEGRLRTSYQSYDSNTQSIWASPDPGGS
jgi:Flp pilus assembly pilin Flp